MGSELRPSVRATFDSRETGPRYHVTTRINDETIAFQQPIDDPFVRQTVTVGWRDLLRGLVRGQLEVAILVGANPELMNDVLELDENTLIRGRTRNAAFRAHLSEAMTHVGEES